MVSCSDFIRDYSDYRDGFLSREELAATEAHLSGCDSCQRYERVVSAGIDELLSIPEIEPSDDFLNRLQHQIYHVDAERGVLSREGSGASTVFVVVLLTLIGAAAWFPVIRQAANTVELAPVAATAPASQLETLTLFRTGPLLLPSGSPTPLVSSGKNDVFAGYGLGAYMVSRSPNSSR
jgi:anti-sigma factor RsiW